MCADELSEKKGTATDENNGQLIKRGSRQFSKQLDDQQWKQENDERDVVANQEIGKSFAVKWLEGIKKWEEEEGLQVE